MSVSFAGTTPTYEQHIFGFAYKLASRKAMNQQRVKIRNPRKLELGEGLL